MYEGVVQDLIDELGRLPGVGPKSAQRIAFHLLTADPADVTRLSEVLAEVKAKVRFCERCGNVACTEATTDCTPVDSCPSKSMPAAPALAMATIKYIHNRITSSVARMLNVNFGGIKKKFQIRELRTAASITG